MSKFIGTIHVFVKTDVNNPADTQILIALHRLGFTSVSEIKMGKCFLVSFKAANEADARAELTAMCKKLLAFSVSENFKIIEIKELQETAMEKPPMDTADVKLDIPLNVLAGSPSGYVEQDAPLCPQCGLKTTARGAAYICHNCGESLGAS